MSTGNINLDILLKQIQDDAISNSTDAVKELRKRYPSLSEKEAEEIHLMIASLQQQDGKEKVSLVLTAPPTYAIKVKPTKIVVDDMLKNAKRNILITGYSISDYFNDLLDCIIQKSQEGVFVKFFVNDAKNQSNYKNLCRYKGRFLQIYNYPRQDDSMSALHAKVISVDERETLITSANLSYHGQEGNIELGTHILSTDIARQVGEIFTQLIFRKIFVEV